MKLVIWIMALVVGLVGLSYAQFYEPEHLWHRSGGENHSYFGYYAAGICDVNGDGCEDFLAFDSEGDTSWVSLFYGGNPPDTIPDMIFRNSSSIGFPTENVGDVNGDGWQDFAIHVGSNRVFIYYSGEILDTIPDVVLTESIGWDAFGCVIKGLGDVNGDEYDDIAVQAPNYPFPECYGKVWIYFGGNPMDSTADWVQEGSGNLALFGKSIAGKGDLNADGYDDFVISEYLNYPTQDSVVFHVYYGGTQLDTIPDFSIEAWNYIPQFYIYTPAAMIPNLNGDQYSDLVIVTQSHALVFQGGNPMDTDIDLVLSGFYPSLSNMNISTAGDVNDDGYGDIIVAQLDAYTYGGLVLVFLGNFWMSGQPDMYWIGSPLYGLGKSLVDCGDINGDGVDDIMFGSWHEDMNGTGCLDIWEGDRAFVVHAPIETSTPVPNVFHLLAPYPNPFNSTVVIPFELTSGVTGNVSLIIYNVLGQMVVDLRGEVRRALSGQGAGQYEVTWNGKDLSDIDVGSGVYIIVLQWGGQRQLRKAVLLR